MDTDDRLDFLEKEYKVLKKIAIDDSLHVLRLGECLQIMGKDIGKIGEYLKQVEKRFDQDRDLMTELVQMITKLQKVVDNKLH